MENRIETSNEMKLELKKKTVLKLSKSSEIRVQNEIDGISNGCKTSHNEPENVVGCEIMKTN